MCLCAILSWSQPTSLLCLHAVHAGSCRLSGGCLTVPHACVSHIILLHSFILSVSPICVWPSRRADSMSLFPSSLVCMCLLHYIVVGLCCCIACLFPSLCHSITNVAVFLLAFPNTIPPTTTYLFNSLSKSSDMMIFYSSVLWWRPSGRRNDSRPMPSCV